MHITVQPIQDKPHAKLHDSAATVRTQTSEQALHASAATTRNEFDGWIPGLTPACFGFWAASPFTQARSAANSQYLKRCRQNFAGSCLTHPPSSIPQPFDVLSLITIEFQDLDRAHTLDTSERAASSRRIMASPKRSWLTPDLRFTKESKLERWYFSTSL